MEFRGQHFPLQQQVIDYPQYRNRSRVFMNRLDAAQRLAELLLTYWQCNPLLIPISNGGAEIAVEIAKIFSLDVVLAPAEKVQLPWDSDTDYAAIAFDGTAYIDEGLVSRNTMNGDAIKRDMQRARAKMGTPPEWFTPRMQRHVLLVDDGIANPVAMLATIKALQAHHIKQISIATPTGYDKALNVLNSRVDAVFCTNVWFSHTRSVADAYKDFVNEPDLLELTLQAEITSANRLVSA